MSVSGGGRTGSARFAGALGAQLAVSSRRNDMATFNVGHLSRHRDQIIGHVAVEQLAALVVEAVFKQCSTNALYNAAANLLVDKLRVNDGAAIFHAPVF